jgi:hypothetical protein
VSGVPAGPGNAAGLNNAGNDPSGAGNSSKSPNAPGTNSLGTANASGAPQGGVVNGGHGSIGTTTGTGAGAGGRIDGTVQNGPAMNGDNAIREEDAVDSKVDKKIKSICKGC